MAQHSGLIFDIGVILVIILSTVLGYRRGFILTFFGLFRWVICMLIAYFLTPEVRDFIIQYTTVDDSIESHIRISLSSKIMGAPIYNALPVPYKSFINDASHETVEFIAQSITRMLLAVITFLLLLFIFRIMTRLLVHLFSAKENDGFIGGLDRFFGTLVGAGRGFVLVLIITLIMFPLVGILGPQTADPILESLHDSSFADYLYYNNPLLYFLNML